MSNPIWIEIIGYVGMAFVLVSFMMKKVKWIRILNMVGAVLSCLYGILTLTIPTACLNGSLLIINGVMLTLLLIKEHKEKET